MRGSIALLGTALLLASSASAARAADGKELYEANCAKCHGQTGLADTTTGKAAKAKKFKGDEHLLGPDVADFVKKSIHDPEKKKHKEVAKKVTDDDLAAIAVYVKALAAP